MKRKPIVVLIVVLVLAACSSSPAPTATNPPPTPTRLVVVPTVEATAKPTTVAPATVPAQPIGQPVNMKAAIVAALEALDKNGPYRMTITASSEAGGPVTLEVVPPDRSRYSGSVDGKPVEVINIGTALLRSRHSEERFFATKQSPSLMARLVDGRRDCFAALAMTTG